MSSVTQRLINKMIEQAGKNNVGLVNKKLHKNLTRGDADIFLDSLDS